MAWSMVLCLMEAMINSHDSWKGGSLYGVAVRLRSGNMSRGHWIHSSVRCVWSSFPIKCPRNLKTKIHKIRWERIKGWEGLSTVWPEIYQGLIQLQKLGICVLVPLPRNITRKRLIIICWYYNKCGCPRILWTLTAISAKLEYPKMIFSFFWD